MRYLTATRVVLTVATIMFVAWTLLNTLFWPVESYANVTHAYAESTNQIVRGMSLGIAGYLSCLAMVIGWNMSAPRRSDVTAVHRQFDKNASQTS